MSSSNQTALRPTLPCVLVCLQDQLADICQHALQSLRATQVQDLDSTQAK